MSPSSRILVAGLLNGWGGRIRTSECKLQRLVSYHLTTPQWLLLAGFGRLGFKFRFVRFQDFLLDQPTCLVVDRMSHILMCPVRPFPARHGNEISLVAGYYFHAPYDKGIVEGHIGETFQPFLITQDDSDFCDLHDFS